MNGQATHLQRYTEVEWFVEFETRPRGAIGEFERRADLVRACANDPATAVLRAQNCFHLAGYETRFPITVRHSARLN